MKIGFYVLSGICVFEVGFAGEDLALRLRHVTGTQFQCVDLLPSDCESKLSQLLKWNWSSVQAPGGVVKVTSDGLVKNGRLLREFNERLARESLPQTVSDSNAIPPGQKGGRAECTNQEDEKAQAERQRARAVAVDQVFKAVTEGPNPRYFKRPEQIVRFTCTHTDPGPPQKVSNQVWEYDRDTGAARFFGKRGEGNNTPDPRCSWPSGLATQEGGVGYDFFAVGHGIFSFSPDCKSWSSDYQWQTTQYQCSGGGKGSFGSLIRGQTRFNNGGQGISSVDSASRDAAVRSQISMVGNRSCQADPKQVEEICKKSQVDLEKCSKTAPPIVTGTTLTCPVISSGGGTACPASQSEQIRGTGAYAFTIKSCRETNPNDESLRDTFLIERYSEGVRYAYGPARLNRDPGGNSGTLEYPWTFENQGQFVGLGARKINGATRIQVEIRPSGELEIAKQCIRLEYNTIEGGGVVTLANIPEAERKNYASAAPAPGLYKLECMEK